MKKTDLWALSVGATAENEDAVTDLLENLFAQPASTFHCEKTTQRRVTVYLPAGARPSRAALESLHRHLQQIRHSGLSWGPESVKLQRFPRENWAESWKRHFHAFSVGASLLVKPSWSRRKPRPRQATLVIDPGLAFGTGQHATTAFCLQQVVKHRPRHASSSLLDIGTGSGILAIAAAKLGYSPIGALDLDPAALEVAKANARGNSVLGQIRFQRRDLDKLPLRARQKFDLVCANLIHDLLLAQQPRIVERVRAGGLLVLAGILRSQFPGVRRSYQQAGLRLVDESCAQEWHSGAFERGDALH